LRWREDGSSRSHLSLRPQEMAAYAAALASQRS
jgi:hypothetical protein